MEQWCWGSPGTWKGFRSHGAGVASAHGDPRILDGTLLDWEDWWKGCQGSAGLLGPGLVQGIRTRGKIDAGVVTYHHLNRRDTALGCVLPLPTPGVGLQAPEGGSQPQEGVPNPWSVIPSPRSRVPSLAPELVQWAGSDQHLGSFSPLSPTQPRHRGDQLQVHPRAVAERAEPRLK